MSVRVEVRAVVTSIDEEDTYIEASKSVISQSFGRADDEDLSDNNKAIIIQEISAGGGRLLTILEEVKAEIEDQVLTWTKEVPGL